MKGKLLLFTLLLAVPLSATTAAEAMSDGLASPPDVRPIFYNLPGADDAGLAKSTSGIVSNYLFIAGSAFTPRSSAQTVSYGGSGCTASNAAVTTDLQLPAGAQVEGIRLYYYDLAVSGGVGLFFTTYDGIGGSNDLLGQASTLKVGYSSEYFALDSPYEFDSFTNAHVITATMNDEQYFCGARVYYTQ